MIKREIMEKYLNQLHDLFWYDNGRRVGWNKDDSNTLMCCDGANSKRISKAVLTVMGCLDPEIKEIIDFIEKKYRWTCDCRIAKDEREKLLDELDNERKNGRKTK